MSSTSYQEVGTIPPHLETKIEDPLEDATMNFVENPSGNAKVFHFPATLNECQSRPAGAIIPELKHVRQCWYYTLHETRAFFDV